LKDVISPDDKQKILTAVKDALTWLESHPSEEKETYEEKRKEVEAISTPIITKAYQQKGGESGGAAASSSEAEVESESTSSYTDSNNESSSGPTVEEVDED